MRAAGKDENIVLIPPIKYTLEQALEFIERRTRGSHTVGNPSAKASAQGT